MENNTTNNSEAASTPVATPAITPAPVTNFNFTPNSSKVESLWDDIPTESSPPPAKSEKEASEEPVDVDTTPRSEEEDEVPEKEEETEETEEDEDDEDKAKEEEEEEPKKVENVKSYKVKLEDGSDVEIKDTTKFRIKVDGEIKTVDFKDLKASYNGEVNYGKRIQDAELLKKQISKTYTELNDYASNLKRTVSEIDSLVEKDDALGAVEMIAQLTGKDPIQYGSKLLLSFEKFYRELASKPVAERSKIFLERKLAHQQRQSKIEQEQREAAEIRRVAAEQVEQAEKAYGFSREELRIGMEYLAKDKTPEEINKITLKDVTQVVLGGRIIGNINSAIESLGITLHPEDHKRMYETFMFEETRGGQHLDLEDYIEIIKLATNHEAKKNQKYLSKKASKLKPSKKPDSKNTSGGSFVGKSLDKIWDDL